MFAPDKIKKQLFSACIVFFSCLPLALSAETIKTYILTGQSNGNGYGLAYGDISQGTLIPNQNLTDIGRADLLTSNESAHIYQGAWTTGVGSWESLAPGFASWNGIRFGPELSFGHKMQSELGEPIVIIKYTPNGTSLYSEWLEGQYDLLIETINNAKASAAERDWELDIQDLLWMQGESDSFGVNAPAAYEENLTTFIAKVRDGLAIPDLKFHVAEIADTTTWPARQQIWDAQAAVAAADDDVVIVASRDFPLFANDASGSVNVHFSTAGVVTLGEAFASSVVGEDVTTTPTPTEEPGAGTSYISHTVNDNSIVIDANLDDWSAVESLGYDGETLQDAGIKADFVEGWIAHDNNSLYVAYKNNGDIDTVKSWPWQVYFDTDGSKLTGLKIDDNIGAEYMLQGSGVYKYTGSGSDWSWQYIISATGAVNGPIAEYKIPRLALSFPDKLSVLFKARNVAFTGDYAESGVDTYPRQLEHISLHYGLMQGQSVIWEESGGVQEMTLSEAASEGSTTLLMSETYQLLNNQLISYLSDNGEYYTAQVATSDGASITLTKPLEASIAQGQNLWNFYGDDSHPNLFGFRAVADFAIREMGIASLNSGKHVLLGDSWFDKPGFYLEGRLAQRLSGATIVNKGVGGHTSADMLSRFDADVASENPDVVWVIAGINDATSDVLAPDYLANMQAIIAKIRSIGAKPMIFDSQVAQLFFGSDYRTQLTHSYSQDLGNADSAVQYQLSDPVLPPETDTISNPKTIAIDGDLTDWDGLQAFGQDADDINEAGAKADLLEAWMAHDDNAFYIAYKNDGDIDTTTWWPWQVFLDTDNNQGTGYQVGNGVGASYLVQGSYLFSYIGTGYDWAWQFVEAADYHVNAGIAELKFSRTAINNPNSLSTVMKARNGFFTNNYTSTGVDSFPDLDQGHFNYTFSGPIPE